MRSEIPYFVVVVLVCVGVYVFLFEELLLTSRIVGVSRKDLIYSLRCNMSELMQREDFPNLVTWNHSNGSILTVAGCDLGAIDIHLARECFAKNAPEGIMMIGDSLTRYQYLNLVYFLVHGVWGANSDLPNENEHKYKNWKQFFHVTNERMGGHEVCDCFRNHVNHTVEYRYFDDGEVRIAYRMIFGRDTPILLHDPELLNVSSCRTSKCRKDPALSNETWCQTAGCKQALCAPGTCSQEVVPILNFGRILDNGVIQRLVETYPASLIFFNSGLWWHVQGHNNFSDHRNVLVDELLRFRRARPAAALHWKMTTASRMHVPPEFAFARDVVAAGAFDGFFDTWSLTIDIARNPAGLMWPDDNSHFEPRVYEGLNRALIAYVCSLPAGR